MSRTDDLALWQRHRSLLLGIAYRMLGDLGRAEDVLQDAWLRWSTRTGEADDPRAYLVTLVTRSCLTQLGSASVRREETRAILPEPIDLAGAGFERVDALERISMAFLVLLQRLTPAERAVLVLHEVFDYDHAEIAALVGKSTPACRKLLERARSNVAAERRMLSASREEHARLFEAFIRAATEGDSDRLVSLLAEDAVLVSDGGVGGRTIAGIRNLDAPLHGRDKIAAFVVTTSERGATVLAREQRELNGQAALLLHQGGRPAVAIMLGIADGRIARVYVQADPTRLTRLARVD